MPDGSVATTLGLGTGSLNGKACYRTVKAALELGYRHVDTADAYDNEAAIGNAIEDAAVRAEDVVLATKIHSRQLSYDDVIASTRRSCRKLGVEAVDLTYVHWPAHTYDPEETIAALEYVRDIGLSRQIGVSNFTRSLLREAQSVSSGPLDAIQVEFHPYFQQRRMQSYAVENDLTLVAHTPLGGGIVLDDPTLTRIANEHDTSVVPVVLAWLLDKENVSVVHGASRSHLSENLEARNLELSPADSQRIDDLDRSLRTVDYEFAPWN